MENNLVGIDKVEGTATDESFVSSIKDKRIRIFKSPWHTGHDHDLIEALSPIADFGLLINYTRRWDDKNRPLPANTEWVTHYEKGKYDLVILNIDQQCSNMNLNKSILTRQMKQSIREIDPDVPIITINHGTPVYPEAYKDARKEDNYVSELLKKEILDVVAPDYMVVNSDQAQKEWGYEKSRAIIHGMNPDEWVYKEDREVRSVTFISQAGIGDRYYNRSYLIAIMELLKEKHGINHQWIGQQGSFQPKSGKEYKDYLGSSLIYLNATYASPMPRSRTEAMLSGCCIVTTPQHGASEFIKDGENGFIIPHDNVEYAVGLLAKLINNYEVAKYIGQQGRKTALEIFNRDRYRDDWMNLLRELNILK